MFSFLIESFLDTEHRLRWALHYIFNGVYMMEIFDTHLEAQRSLNELYQSLLEG